jgi:hypothetical protein
VAELFGLWLQCWCMGEKGKGARAGLDAMRKSREGVWLGGGGCQVEEQGGRGRGGRQRPDATEAGADRAMSRGGGASGQLGPTWTREGACGPRLEHVGRSRRRKMIRARRNIVIFY